MYSIYIKMFDFLLLAMFFQVKIFLVFLLNLHLISDTIFQKQIWKLDTVKNEWTK